MKEGFRVWFIFEVTCFSLPVCLSAGLTLKLLSLDMPITVFLSSIAFFIGCCCSVYAVAKLMLFVFGERHLNNPKLIVGLLVLWLFAWLPIGYSALAAKSFVLGVGFILPLLVVGHLSLIALKKVKADT